MKRNLSFFLALILICSCFTFRSPDANALGAVWIKEFKTDKFGDKTDECYITNKSQFKGTFNSDSINNGKLGVTLMFERDGEDLLAYVVLFLQGKDQVKNGAYADREYDISVKKSDGTQFTTTGGMLSGEDRIEVLGSIDLANAFIESNGEISIYIEELNNATNNYLFKAKCGNFKEIYNKEILGPYQEEQYQKAEQLLKDKQFDAAAEAFESISGFTDSADRAAEALEAKNAEAYAIAEELLKSGKYDQAKTAFLALGDYKDSPDQAKLCDYTYAGMLDSEGSYEEAIKIYEELGSFLDSNEKMQKAQEGINNRPYNILRNHIIENADEHNGDEYKIKANEGEIDVEYIIVDINKPDSVRVTMDLKQDNQLIQMSSDVDEDLTNIFIDFPMTVEANPKRAQMEAVVDTGTYKFNQAVKPSRIINAPELSVDDPITFSMPTMMMAQTVVILNNYITIEGLNITLEDLGFLSASEYSEETLESEEKKHLDAEYAEFYSSLEDVLTNKSKLFDVDVFLRHHKDDFALMSDTDIQREIDGDFYSISMSNWNIYIMNYSGNKKTQELLFMMGVDSEPRVQGWTDDFSYNNGIIANEYSNGQQIRKIADGYYIQYSGDNFDKPYSIMMKVHKDSGGYVLDYPFPKV